MILVRDVFKLKFGKAKEAITLWKEGREIMKSIEHMPDRVLTDLVSTYYTFVLETTYRDVSEMEASLQKAFKDERWQKWYQKFVPLAESGYREIFNIVE
jgi:transposase-like protein